MLLPIRSKNPPESFPFVTCTLILINVLVFALTSNGFSIREDVCNQWCLKGSDFNVVNIFTSMFLHGDIFHLLGNVWFLYLFGFAVEGRLRPLKFGILYFVAGFAGDLLHQAILGRLHPDIPSLGASGAIMGVLGAALYMFPHAQMTFFYWIGWFWRGVFDWPMWGVGLLYLGFDLLFAYLNGTDGGGGVGHLIHLGGAGAGFLIAMALRPSRDTQGASEAKATLADLKELRYLSQRDMAEMARSNPDDTTLLLNMVDRAIREGNLNDDLRKRFLQMLPRMLESQPITSVGSCLSVVYQQGDLTPRQLLHIASQLEKAPEPRLALRFYEIAYGEPSATQADHEACLFRVGLLCESSLGNAARAVASYETIVHQFPMSPLADQARARLAVLKRVSV